MAPRLHRTPETGDVRGRNYQGWRPAAGCGRVSSFGRAGVTKRRKMVWGAILLVVVLLVAVFVGIAMSRGPKAKPVQLSKIERQDLQAKVSANGKIQATKKVDISATVPGQVVQLAVKEGDVVKKGQFLLQLDPANYRASARGSQSSMEALQKELDAAVANLEQAKADFARAERNHAAGILADADLQRAKTAVTSGE